MQKDCVACESGECLEHQVSAGEPPTPAEVPGEPAGAPPVSETAALRAELDRTRKSVAKTVKRFNRAMKEARKQAPPPEPIEEVPANPPPPERKHSDVTKLGLRFLDSCRRKGK